VNTSPPELIEPEQLQRAADLAARVLEQLDRILLGRADLHRLTLIGVLSRGHILLEGLPGLGKTALVHAIGSVLQLDFKRIQFTPDLMPSDILGAHILEQTEDGHREMLFRPGPVFTNILLADEINRASPKTQAAMLETMQERSVTLMGTTRELPRPFFVLASQNPIELEGTYPLPEAQIDRFLFRILVPDVTVDVLTDIISTRRHGVPPTPSWTLGRKELDFLFATADLILLPNAVARYIARLVHATHPEAAEATAAVRDYVQYGASPRAAIAIAEAARAHALIDGRPTVGFADVKSVTPSVLNHRVILNYRARFDNLDSTRLIAELLAELDEADLNLPVDIAIQKDS